MAILRIYISAKFRFRIYMKNDGQTKQNLQNHGLKKRCLRATILQTMVEKVIAALFTVFIDLSNDGQLEMTDYE